MSSNHWYVFPCVTQTIPLDFNVFNHIHKKLKDKK